MLDDALQKCIDGTPEERRYLCSLSFHLFAVYYFDHYFKYALPPYQKMFVKDLEEVVECKFRELVLIGFRESAKTSFAKLHLIWMIAYKKRKYINVDSFDKENAERILFDIAYELSNNKRLKQDFGVLFSKERGISDVKQNRINNFITENGIRIEAHSTGESVRGRLHLNQRPDFLLMDDFENNRTKTSAIYTKQINEHITEAMGGLAENGVIVYLANYLTESGNVQYLINRSKTDDKIRLRNVPIVENDKPVWEDKYCMTDEEAKLTGKVSIESKKLQFGSYVFSYEFMNQPIDDAMSEFKKEYERYITMQEVERISTLKYVVIDTALSEKSSADFTGITIAFVDKNNFWYVKSFRVRFNPKDLFDYLFTIWKNISPETIGIEKTIYLQAIKPFLEDEMRKRGIFMHITELQHNQTAKETRIRGMIPRWESKSIILIEGECEDLKEEMRTFPNGRWDDTLDSFAYLPQVVVPPEDEREELQDRQEARMRQPVNLH